MFRCNTNSLDQHRCVIRIRGGGLRWCPLLRARTSSCLLIAHNGIGDHDFCAFFFKTGEFSSIS